MNRTLPSTILPTTPTTRRDTQTMNASEVYRNTLLGQALKDTLDEFFHVRIVSVWAWKCVWGVCCIFDALRKLGLAALNGHNQKKTSLFGIHSKYMERTKTSLAITFSIH